MRYETARLADFSVLQGEEKRKGFDRSFFALVMLLLLLGVIMVLSASFPRAYYDPGRITTWRDPFSSSSDEGDQIVQSIYTIGSGGLGGVGLGASRQKYLYLPEEHNDFIFSVLCEELGFLGAVLVLVLFAMLILRGYRIALRCADPFSFLVTAGITTLLALQLFLNWRSLRILCPVRAYRCRFLAMAERR